MFTQEHIQTMQRLLKTHVSIPQDVYHNGSDEFKACNKVFYNSYAYWAERNQLDPKDIDANLSGFIANLVEYRKTRINLDLAFNGNTFGIDGQTGVTGFNDIELKADNEANNGHGLYEFFFHYTTSKTQG